MKLALPELQKAGQKLQSEREAKGQSKRGIARRANVRHSFVNRVESGTQAPSVLILHAYSQMCGIDLDELLIRFGHIPADIMQAFRANPSLCNLVRSQLSLQ